MTAFLALAVSTLVLILVSPFDVRLSAYYFQLSHVVIDSIGIIIIAMIFVVVWFPLTANRNARSKFLACIFLGVGCMEAAHLATMNGILSESITNATIMRSNFSMVTQAFAVIALTLAGLYGVAETTLWIKNKKAQRTLLIYVYTACALLAMFALLSIQSINTTEPSNFPISIYKLFACSCLLRAFVLSHIQSPYHDILNLQKRYESILNALPDLVFEVTEQGKILHFHSNNNKLTLITEPSAFIGKKFEYFLPKDAATVCEKAIEESHKNGFSDQYQYSLALSTGIHHFEISVVTLPQVSEERSYLCVIRDISKRFETEQRLEALLKISEESEGLDEYDILKLGLSTLEILTHSAQSYIHIVEKDIENHEIVAWHSQSRNFFEVEQYSETPNNAISKECTALRCVGVLNKVAGTSLASERPAKLPELTRLISTPIFEGEKIAMVIAVTNADYDYSNATLTTVKFFASELYQVIKRRRAQRNLERNQRLFNSALDNLPVGVAITKPSVAREFLYLNPCFYEAYDIEHGTLSDLDQFWVKAFDDPDDRSSYRTRMIADIASDDPKRLVQRRIPIYRKKQLIRYLDVQHVLVPNSPLIVSVIQDVTDKVLRDEELRIAAAAFSSQEGILIADAHNKILRVNRSFEASTGYCAEELIGKTPKVLRSDYHDEEYYQRMVSELQEHDVWRGEIWNKHRDGSVAPYSLTISAVRSELGEITHYVGDYINLSEIRTAQETISKLAYFDTLTGLPNRERLKTLIAEHLTALDNTTRISSALMIDLDNFKTINDTQGHDAGDTLLIQVAGRIRRLLRPEDQLARYGSDEFVVILQDVGDNIEQASLKTQLVAQSILSNLEDTYKIREAGYYTTCCIGATLLNSETSASKGVMGQLDIALANAKSEGHGSICYFDPTWQAAVIEQAQLLNELRAAIKDHQFELYYQPQINIDGQIVGAEALIRWNHPDKGLLSPVDFLPIAQEHRLMKKIGDEVIQLGLRQLQQWQQHDVTTHLKLSLNITADQFYEEFFEPTLHQSLEQHDIVPGTLMLEFTESVLLGNLTQANEKVQRLKEHHIKFAIDDFGTGYSSLSYLSKLHVDQLKIDRSFVQSIGVIESDAMIVKTIIDMAHTLRMHVIAEGVETKEQHKFLLDQGCEMFQGYLFSKPLPIVAFNQLISNALTKTIKN